MRQLLVKHISLRNCRSILSSHFYPFPISHLHQKQKPFASLSLSPSLSLSMDNKRRRKEPKTSNQDSEEVSSIEWEIVNMTQQEEDLIYRMYRLVGDRWALIAGRIPGRKPEEIERFWIMRHGEGFAEKSEAQANDS